MGDYLDKAAPLGQPRPALSELSLYMETPAAAAQELPPREQSDILLFFKFYDHQKQELKVQASSPIPCKLAGDRARQTGPPGQCF